MKTILETKHLCKNFKNQNAVNQVSISIEEGSIYGLLGPNGAGKSTTLKMIAGMLKPTSGDIIFDGHRWNRKDIQKIGALIETPPLYENLCAQENLNVRRILFDLPESRIGEVLEMVDLTKTGKKKVGQFSMGMKQRLGIALALLNKPKLLILDEPTNGLDPIGIQGLRKLIKLFQKQGMTVILSSHVLSEVELLADHIGIIAGGVLSYSDQIDPNVDLEKLFIQVIERNRKEDE